MLNIMYFQETKKIQEKATCGFYSYISQFIVANIVEIIIIKIKRWLYDQI
ncbi:conserved hypothetical protein [Vibrio chagasii]|nr:conserved hypothetical protein [Vibrio chagasii]CAH6854739.1 conserved hypothetical protein [Vibrio chagasii]CAH6862934.1 conserved hypothetical protein [Vibrio chagasii]CAH6972721.1 conserved hypothetical protein [Vibrio chagasii]CAH7008099.1 conserved hypothetical protein [Vibrio chagasii]